MLLLLSVPSPSQGLPVILALLKSATSESLRICATGQETFPEDLITPGASAEVVAKETRIKSLKEMPGPSAVSNLIEFFYRDGFSRIHEIQMEHSQKYGKIFKSRFGPQLVVSIAGRDLVAEVLRTEVLPAERQHGVLEGVPRPEGDLPGLISAEGEDWLKMRSILRQLIMRPKDVAQFSDDVNAVVEDLVKRVDTLRSQQSDGLTVLNINDLFSNTQWKVGMAAILYEDRLGCLENEIPQKSQDYIAALHLMFSSFKMTMYAGAIPKWLRTVVPRPWQEFCSSWDGLFSFSQIHVDKRLGEIQDLVSRGETVKGGLLTHMLVTREMNLEEIYANMTEMLLAGVDTTSFTLSWACYLLARHPEVQQEIYEEVTRTLGHGTIPTADDVPRLPLIRGLVKETLRMFPVLPGNGHSPHILPVSSPPQTQLALCHYSTSMDERISPGLMTSVQTAGSGRTLRTGWISRIAELEMHLALTQGGNHTHTHTHTHTVFF
uniref:Uncharacterized protein n=1 Tax=Oncorhynchus tshawytscha TaxID=74940 RepID=A0AAZ3PR50_ONCTS